jgi:LmbE family N-acetylglucosaminyl deacetylase/CheY-like chemotaxis protein
MAATCCLLVSTEAHWGCRNDKLAKPAVKNHQSLASDARTSTTQMSYATCVIVETMVQRHRSTTRILLLEDSKEFALLLKHWIMHAGYQLDLAEDIPQAEQLLESNIYDILLSDIELPSGASFTFLEYAKQKLPHVAVVVMTSQQRADYAVQALRLKANEFLFKPFNELELIQKLDQLNLEQRTLRQVILALGAHPDDVELGCGASLAAHVARGDLVHILTLCGGEAGGAASERIEESRHAAAILGAKLTLAQLTDTQISEGADTIGVIEKCIREVQPQVVYTHSEKDGHQDHRNAFRATLVAARQVPSLLCYEAPSGTVQFMPTRFIEITPHLLTKQKAIAAYRSQVSIRPYMQPALIEATARYWGRFAGYGLCEAFEVVRERSS